MPFVAMTSITPRVCRYEPTCSHYAEQAVRRHGVVRGLGMAGLAAPALQPVVEGRV